MDRKELELALLHIGQAIQTIVGAYRPDANSIRLSIFDKRVNVKACVHDYNNCAEDEYVLDATLLENGTMRFWRE